MLSMAYTASTLSKNAIYKKCYNKEPWENMWIKTQGDPDGWLEFNFPLQHKYGYIGDEVIQITTKI